jgi:trimethylamine---corrinoid protein Co-methyltransferase
MRPSFTLLDQALLERIVGEAYDVLQLVGVLVENQQATELLLAAGCRPRGQRLLISAALIQQCLKTVPRRITMYDRSGRPAMNLADREIHFDPGSSALNVLDWPAQKERKPTTRDLVDLARLTDALPHLAGQSTGLVSSDMPQEIVDRYRLYIALLHSSKPVITGTFSLSGFTVMHELLSAVRGSSAALREQPLAIFDCCPSPPLKWSNLTCQALIDCARAGIPAEFVSMPLTGSTAPVTLSGSLVQHTAETLSGIVIGQLAAPGAPLIYGGSPVAMDLRTGTTPMGAIETMMIECGYAEIGRYFNMPTHAYMTLSDAKVLDAQSGLEAAMSATLAALTGINVISGPGMMDFENCISLEKLVIDHEICAMVKRLTRGVQARGERLAEDLYGDIDAGEHFLTSDNTIRYLRDEFAVPSDVIDRDPYRVREIKGEWTIGERAHQRVLELLKNHPSQLLDDRLRLELDHIMLTDAKTCGVDKLPEQ